MYVRIPVDDREDLESLFDEVNRTLFFGNLTADIDRIKVSRRSITYRVKLGVVDSYSYGARTAASGRHGAYACWHVFRDVLGAWFEAHQSMVARTALATYQGAEGFAENFPRTYSKNVGSQFYPASMGELCQCYEDGHDAADVQPIGAAHPTARREDRPRRAAHPTALSDSYVDAAQSAMARAESMLVGFDLSGIPILSGDAR